MARISVDRAEVASFCQRYHIRLLALFESVLREDFSPDSDIDVLVDFETGHLPDFLASLEWRGSSKQSSAAAGLIFGPLRI